MIAKTPNNVKQKDLICGTRRKQHVHNHHYHLYSAVCKVSEMLEIHTGLKVLEFETWKFFF